LAAAGSLAAQTWQEWLNLGVQAYKNAQYPEAVSALRKAADLNPSEVAPRLYLGMACMQQYIPGSKAPDNLATAEAAQAELQRVLELDSTNREALAGLASLNLSRRKLDDAREWYGQLLNIDPNNWDAYYSLAFIAWSQWYPAWRRARERLGMKPDDAGPLPDPAARADLRGRWWPVIEDGIGNLRRALAIDPSSADAMAYTNLFLRERADLRDTIQEYQQDIAQANEWDGKTIAAKRKVAPRRVAMFGTIERPLIRKSDPIYPSLALQAGVHGIVQLKLIVGKDGHVRDVQIIRGHRLLIPAAIEVVKKYVHKPTLLNRQPIEVETVVAVNFVLSDGDHRQCYSSRSASMGSMRVARRAGM